MKSHSPIWRGLLAVSICLLVIPASMTAHAEDGGDFPESPEYRALESSMNAVYQATEQSPHYNGITLDEKARKVQPYLTLGAADEVSAAHQIAGQAVEIIEVERSYSQLLEKRDQVVHDGEWRQASGIRSFEAWPDPRTNSVHVSVADPNAAAVREIESRYGGSEWVTVVAGAPRVPLTRLQDSPPFNGGNRVWFQGQGGECTTGIPVQANSSSNTYQIIAAHCVNMIGRVVMNSSLAVGHVAYADWSTGTNSTDTALIYTSSSSDLLWRTNTVRNQQLNSTVPTLVDHYVCFSGSFTLNEVCSAKVVAIDICATEVGPSAPCGAAVAERTDPIIVAQSGDSGGPVYALYPNGLQPRGMISYGYPPPYQITAGCNASLCSRKVGFYPADRILQRWGVHLY